MEIFFSRLQELKGKQSAAAFARSIGIPQPSMDRYLKGRVPTLEVLKLLCSVYNVSADWLLGLPDRTGGAVVTGSSGVAIATGGGSATVSTPPPSCSACPYKALAEALKKVQGL